MGNFKSVMKAKKTLLSISSSSVQKNITTVNKNKVLDHFGSDWKFRPSMKFFVDFFESCEFHHSDNKEEELVMTFVV
ncbi:hypothetical protein PR048_017043 [Dryococelus australis]|uniref:Uncharacterized protein n=1 Tax=Dryococelus australis TaxID=614101 RepID=A0ABQ9H8F5_9NEOP|nr:hypothetical protein PR048_017043 [Dryococelus australis]